MSKQKQIINRIKTLVKEYKSLNESAVTITKQDMDRLHSGEEVDIDGHLLKFVDESVNEAKELKWQDAETGDMANVKSINKTGLIIKAYGRKFHLQFANGSTKTYDANDLTFIKNESINEVNKDNIPYTYKNQ